MRLEFEEFMYISPVDRYISAAQWGKAVGLDPDIIRPRLTRYKKAGYITTKKASGLNKYRLTSAMRKKILDASGKEKFKKQFVQKNILTLKDELFNKFMIA